MKKTVLAPSLLMAGLLAAGIASADPYASWKGYSSSDDDQLTISDSFKDQSRYATSVSEDNDTDVDFQIATPTITSTKDQDQTAGHAASGSAFGTASGHDVGVFGGDARISAGNDEQRFYGPAMVNTNVNQLPTNTTNIFGSNAAPINQSNTFAGRDLGPKGVMAPVGNTSAVVGGNVGQQSGVAFDQAGDSKNTIQDPISSGIRR